MKIFVVDDDEIFQFTTRKMLGYLGIKEELEILNNGKEAIDRLTSGVVPDIIFLDINMPVMDGWDFLNGFQKIKPSLGKAVKIYVVTSSVDDRDMAKATGFDEVEEYLSKPLDEPFLKKVLFEG